MMLVIIIAISGYLIGAVGIGMALGAGLRIASLEQEIAEGLLLYPETPATRSVVFSGTSVPDEAVVRNLSTTMGHSTGLIREQCPVW